MKLKEAIRLAKKYKSRISSNQAAMLAQDAKSLIYWLFLNNSTKELDEKILEDILKATDWTLDINKEFE